MTSWEPASAPRGAVQVPPVVVRLAAGREVRPVWQNPLGGLTFELLPRGRDEHVFIKWTPVGGQPDLTVEAAKLEWAARWTPVPQPLDAGSDSNGNWLMTRAIEGESAVSARWIGSPALAVRAIGRGLRLLHDALPVEKCPYTWSVTERLHAAKTRDRSPAEWHEDHRWLTFEDAWDLLDSPPPVDKLVVCHGDPCSPNTLIGEDGEFLAHVDLGSLGIADRWADLAVAVWSIEWNYGPGWEGLFLRSYGVAPDPVRMRYYRLLWDLSP
jgi:kanamycin kinase